MTEGYLKALGAKLVWRKEKLILQNGKFHNLYIIFTYEYLIINTN